MNFFLDCKIFIYIIHICEWDGIRAEYKGICRIKRNKIIIVVKRCKAAEFRNRPLKLHLESGSVIYQSTTLWIKIKFSFAPLFQQSLSFIIN